MAVNIITCAPIRMFAVSPPPPPPQQQQQDEDEA
jgi:hypothetical protein